MPSLSASSCWAIMGSWRSRGEDLLLTFRHRQTSSYKRLSIISEKRFPAIASCKIVDLRTKITGQAR